MRRVLTLWAKVHLYGSSNHLKMEATLHALSGILLKAIPTFLLVILLHFYLKYMFFKPLEKVLKARYDATEGARKQAADSLEKAAAKTAEYEAALRAARGEIYQAQEQLHRKLQEEQSGRIAAAREKAEAALRDAKAEVGAEMAKAKEELAAESDALASQIAAAILSRGAMA